MRHSSDLVPGIIVHPWHKGLLPVFGFMLAKVMGSYAVNLIQS